MFNLLYIVNRRKQLNFSQVHMAQVLGFANASVYHKYETGEYKLKAEMLPMLAKALKCDVKKIFYSMSSKTEQQGHNEANKLA